MSLNNVANVISPQNAIELLMAQIQYEDIYIYQTWTSLDHMNPLLPTTVEYFCIFRQMCFTIVKSLSDLLQLCPSGLQKNKTVSTLFFNISPPPYRRKHFVKTCVC